MSDAPQDKVQDQEQTWVPVARIKTTAARKEYLVVGSWVGESTTYLQEQIRDLAVEGWTIASVTAHGHNNNSMLVIMEKEDQ